MMDKAPKSTSSKKEFSKPRSVELPKEEKPKLKEEVVDQFDSSFKIQKISTKSSGEVKESLDPLSEYYVVKAEKGVSFDEIPSAEHGDGIRKGLILSKTFPKPEKK